MHYYTFNIADFNNATRHLTAVERAIYRELLDLQYDLETPIPNDLEWICKRICYRDNRTDVEQVLNEYYTVVEQGYTNARVEHEIEAYHAKREAAVRAGKASGKARRRNKKPNNPSKIKDIEQPLNGRSASVEQNRISVEPTNNHKPITNNQSKGAKKTAPKRFIKPTLEQVRDYCKSRNSTVDPGNFFDFNESKGWKVGTAPMKDWQAAIRTWESRDKPKQTAGMKW